MAPKLNAPTHGAVVGELFYSIATCGWTGNSTVFDKT
jgi:hypothetical protein